MTWTSTIAADAEHLTDSQLASAWAMLGSGTGFLVRAARHPHLRPDMRTTLAGHRDSRVRAAFAGRTDLTDEETAAALADTSADVRAAWLSAHEPSPAQLAATCSPRTVRVLDTILRRADEINLSAIAGSGTLAAVLAHALRPASATSRTNARSLADALAHQPPDRLATLARTGPWPDAGEMVAETVATGLLMRGTDALAAGPLDLLVTLLESSPGAWGKVSRLLENRLARGLCATPAPSEALQRLAALASHRGYRLPALEALLYSATTLASSDPLDIVRNRALTDDERTGALSELVNSGSSIPRAIAGAMESNNYGARIVAGCVPRIAAGAVPSLCEAYCARVRDLADAEASAEENPDLAPELAAAMLAPVVDAVRATGDVTLVQALVAAARQYGIRPSALSPYEYDEVAAYVPLSWTAHDPGKLSSQAARSILDASTALADEGFDYAAVGVLVDSLVTSADATPVELIALARDILTVQCPVPENTPPREAGRVRNP